MWHWGRKGGPVALIKWSLGTPLWTAGCCTGMAYIYPRLDAGTWGTLTEKPTFFTQNYSVCIPSAFSTSANTYIDKGGACRAEGGLTAEQRHCRRVKQYLLIAIIVNKLFVICISPLLKSLTCAHYERNSPYQWTSSKSKNKCPLLRLTTYWYVCTWV